MSKILCINDIDFRDGRIVYSLKEKFSLTELLENFFYINTLFQAEYNRLGNILLLDLSFYCNDGKNFFFLIQIVKNNHWDDILIEKKCSSITKFIDETNKMILNI
jgi:hypothetical protein